MNLASWQEMVSRALIDGDTSPFATLDEDLPWRVEVYLRGFVGNDAEGLEDQFPHVAAWVMHHRGAKQWGALVRDFHREFPPQHESRIVCYAPFPRFLAGRPELPGWLADLARLHTAARTARVAPDRVSDLVESTAQIDRFEWDVLSWCGDGEPDLETEPEARLNMVLTWRTEDFTTRHAEVGLLEALLVEAQRGGGTPDPVQLAELEVVAEDIAEAIEALTDAGVLLD